MKTTAAAACGIALSAVTYGAPVSAAAQGQVSVGATAVSAHGDWMESDELCRDLSYDISGLPASGIATVSIIDDKDRIRGSETLTGDGTPAMTRNIQYCKATGPQSALRLRLNIVGGATADSAPFSFISTKPVAVPPTPVTCPTVSSVVSGKNAWFAPENPGIAINERSSWYMPELTWEKASIKVPNDERCEDALISSVVSRGSGKGQIVLIDVAGGCSERGTISCKLSFNEKTYDLNKPAVVKSIRCARVSYSPRESSTPFLLFKQERHYWWTTPAFSAMNARYENFSCLPVPKSVGKYQVVLAQKTAPEKVAATGWHLTCTRVTCSSYYDNVTSIDMSLTTKLTVGVSKTDVTIKGILG